MIGLLVMLTIVFLLTYDPKSRTLETFIVPNDCRVVSRTFGEPVICPPPPSQYLGALT